MFGGKCSSSPANPKPTKQGCGFFKTSSAVFWTDSGPKCLIPFIINLETIPKSFSASLEAKKHPLKMNHKSFPFNLAWVEEIIAST